MNLFAFSVVTINNQVPIDDWQESTDPNVQYIPAWGVDLSTAAIYDAGSIVSDVSLSLNSSNSFYIHYPFHG